MVKKRKHNIRNMFLRGFLQSFFIVGILLGAGVLGYNATMKLWIVKEEGPEVTEVPEPTPPPITVASVDDISKNLIYCYDKDKGKITKLVLEIFHCEKKQLTYITIPLDTQFTMSDILYKKLSVVQPDTPQIIRLSSMTKYFKKDTVFDYGALMIQDMLKLNISYYTVIPMKLYDTIFSEQEVTQESDETAKVFAEVFTKDYISFLKDIKTKKELKRYITKVYPSLITNLSLKDKLNYLDSLWNTPLSNIDFELLPGKELNSGFSMNEIRVSERLGELTAY